MNLSEILNYLLGSTTLVTIYVAWRSRKSEIKKAEANALETIQSVYDKFVRDTDRKIEQMRDEIHSLKAEVQEYKRKCGNCIGKK
jgi:peptidoglycan hydrolase CwlO-like protein